MESRADDLDPFLANSHLNRHPTTEAQTCDQDISARLVLRAPSCLLDRRFAEALASVALRFHPLLHRQLLDQGQALGALCLAPSPEGLQLAMPGAHDPGQHSQIVDEAKTAAKVEADRIVAAGKTDAEQEIVRAKEQLREQLATLVVSGAEKILRREIDAKAHADILAAIKQDL